MSRACSSSAENAQQQQQQQQQQPSSTPPATFRDYMISKQDKLWQQFRSDAASISSSGAPFFEGVRVYVNGYTVPDSLTIKNMLAAHGGVWEQYNGSHVTHIVASQLTHNKTQKFLNASRPKFIVKPEWIVACVEAGRKLPEHNYLLIERAFALQASRASAHGQEQMPNAASVAGCEKIPPHHIGGKFIPEEEEEEEEEEEDCERVPSCGSDQESACGVVTDSPRAGNAASADAEVGNLSHLDPGINGRPTDVWVAQFFAQSRLHYIGSWQQRYERIKASCSVPLQNEASDGRLWTFHVDMDCFFVSVSLKSRPELVGQPVAVSHGRKTGASGEISCASYEARNCGVRAGMFMERAIELCPKLRILPYEFQLYDDASEQMYRVLLGITSSVEAVSCDEAFLSLRTSDPHSVINRIRLQVLECSGCPCSVGCSDAGKLIARMATRSAKPNGFRVIDSSLVPIQQFLDPLPVGDLPGVGRSTRQKLQSAGFNLCQDVRLSSAESMKALLGPALGSKLHRICSGIESTPIELGPLEVNKGSVGKDSIGVQMSWGVRLTSVPHVHIFLRCLAAELCSRASQAGVRGSMITLKLWIRSDGAPEPKKHLGHGVCYQLSKSGSLPPLSTVEITVNELMPALMATLNKCFAEVLPLTASDIRGVGISMSRLKALNAVPDHQNSTSISNSKHADLVRSSHQPLITSRLAPVSLPSKIQLSEHSPIKLAIPPKSNIQLDAPVPAKKRPWREPPISSSQLDHNVLAALPPELRHEVQVEASKVSALKRQNKEFNSRSSFDLQIHQHHDKQPVHSSCVPLDPPSIHRSCVASRTGNSSKEEILEMKRSIVNWMASGPPIPVDVKLVGSIIRSLASSHCLDSLHTFLLVMARCAHSVEGCREHRLLWMEWVGRAIEFAQKQVFTLYGAQLCVL